MRFGGKKLKMTSLKTINDQEGNVFVTIENNNVKYKKNQNQEGQGTNSYLK